MNRFFSPEAVRAPFGNYHHGVVVPSGARWLLASGQLGVSKSDAVPESALEQARLCFRAAEAILREGGMTRADVVRIHGYVTDRAYFADYMRARDEFVVDPAPTSTLIVVAGFTRAELKVEVEVTAARDADG